METSPNVSYETSKKKDKGQFYQMLSLDLENGLHPSSERS